MPLKDLPLDAQPREKLLARGPAALADAELLAILLRTGIAGKNVLQLAQGLLAPAAWGMPRVALAESRGCCKRRPTTCCTSKGSVRPSARNCSPFSSSRGALGQRLRERKVFDSPEAVTHLLQLHLAAKSHEVFAVLFLDSQHRLIALEEMFRGTLTQTSVYPREVVLHALRHQAGAVVLAHNHPSGGVQASAADLALTQTLSSALALIVYAFSTTSSSLQARASRWPRRD